MKNQFNNGTVVIYSMYCSVVAYFIVMNMPSVLLGIGSPVMALLVCIVLGIVGGYIIGVIQYVFKLQNKPQIQEKFFKGVNIILTTTLVLSLVGCAVGIGDIMNTPSQYEQDLNNSMDKTIDEMTPGEKKAFEDYLKWELKEKGIND